MSRDLLFRFVTTGRHPPYGHRTGVFQIAYDLRRNNVFPGSEHVQLDQLLRWFGDNLAEPTRLTVSRNPGADSTAISWIRASAHDHVKRLRSLAALVEFSGIPVVELKTRRPGYIVFEDEHQVVALPFADTPS